jgi:hypothetical protein
MFTSVGVKRVYKTTDGGATWTDITSNMSTLLPVGNIIGLKFHDPNNGYVTAGSTLFYTTNGGTSWTMDLPPVSILFETMAFAPSKVPAGINMPNRKLFVCGVGVGSVAPMMEYGKLSNVEVNSTETVTNASCTSPTGGSITITSTGGLSPYTYSVNGGAFQSSNVFHWFEPGNKNSGDQRRILRYFDKKYHCRIY